MTARSEQARGPQVREDDHAHENRITDTDAPTWETPQQSKMTREERVQCAQFRKEAIIPANVSKSILSELCLL